jgi:signal transduction histidine kinase
VSANDALRVAVKSEDDLATVLSEFARTMLTDFPIQTVLDRLVRRIVDILPVDAAAISLMSLNTVPRIIAGSDASATRYEYLQTVLGEGPCIAAYEENRQITIPNLAEETRFPRYTQRALADGLRAVFTFPLLHEDQPLGVLHLYRKIVGDLSERDMATAQTLTDVATAYLLNAEARFDKTDFVGTVSHELQTPMTSIVGFVDLLLSGEGGPLTPRQEGFLHKIRRGTDRVATLTKDLLTLSSLESTAANHEQQPLDLRTVIASTRELFQPVIAARSVDVTFEAPDDPVIVLGNAAELESLVSNLLSNAMKYTEDGGWVRCTLEVVSGNAHLELEDNGIGIPVEEQPDLFTRFFRSSTAHERGIQGTGLGLTVVHSIVKGHGGDISVASTHLGGSTFSVDLPLFEPVT